MFNGLKLYTIHTKAGANHALHYPIFLREGFSWFAFLFTFGWAFYHRLWAFGLLILAANFCAGLLLNYGTLGNVTVGIVQFAIQILSGLHANDWLRAKLAKKGFIFQDIASGDSLLRAQQRYFDRLVARG